MQSVPLVVVVCVWLFAATVARAIRVGVGIDWTSVPAPGMNEAAVVSQVDVFSVISTTTQGGFEHTSARESIDNTVPQMFPLDVMSQTCEVGIWKPLVHA